MLGRLRTWMAGAALGLAILAEPSIAAGQELPPDIQIDLYLVRADRQVQSQDYGAALATLDVVLALQATNGMETPAELWFKHAQVALDAGYPETAIMSVVRYLQEAGRQGEHYAPALALLDEAQRRSEEGEAPVPAAATPVPTPVAQPGERPGGVTVFFPMLGVNAASMAFTSSEPPSVDASPLTGMAGGLGVAFPLGDGPFGVQLGAQWAQKGARIGMQTADLTADADVSFESVDFWALARVSPSAVGLPVYALVGPYVSFVLDCRVVADASAGTGRFSASDDCTNANLDTQSPDFGLSGGVGVEMGVGAGATSITIGLLYNYGLLDLDRYFGETARHRVLSAHAGIGRTF